MGKEQFDLSYNPDSVLIEGTIVSGTVKTQRSAVAVWFVFPWLWLCSKWLFQTAHSDLEKK